MATGGQKEVGCSLVNVGALPLENPVRLLWYNPCYSGIVVSRDMIIVVDYYACKVQFHRLHDGKLPATHQLKSTPTAICHINDMKVCVILLNGPIEIMTVDSADKIATIRPTRTLHVQGGLDKYHGVMTFQKNLVVCGVKEDTLCWCIVSLNDGHVGTIHQICKGDWENWSYLTTKDNMIYISCTAVGFYSPVTGLYGFDNLNPSQHKYTYKHKDLYNPTGIAINKDGFIFVCNFGFHSCIHHLTAKCQLVSIYRKEIPWNPTAIFWDLHHGHLYVTSRGTNVITTYRPEYPDPIIPVEILRMDNESLQLYKKALRDGMEKIYNIRVMVVGQYGVGKTTLTKRLLGQQVDISEIKSTEGIDVYKHCCKISLDTGEWIVQPEDSEQNLRLQRLAKVLNVEVQKRNSTDKRQNEQTEIIYQRENKGLAGDKYTTDEDTLQLQDVGQDIPSTSASNEELGAESATGKVSDDPAMEILKLLHNKADKLKPETEESIPLTMVDFAGQYAFYTTHQMFLTERAIYLLVSDVSEQVTDPVKDDCYFDMEGIQLRKVYELVEVWLNSIHSCAPSPEADTPPVILVGTHVDQILQDSREEVCTNYFRQIRYEYLGTKPTIVHLADEDFAIDNTVIDQKLDELKQKIVQLASKQPYWGEAIPARWLLLEEHLMSLKSAGVKVIPYSLLEKMNQEGAVKIESREELDLFLKFQHDIGNILYFGTEELKEQIMLDPQWLIYSLKTIITAENFILMKVTTPTAIQKWREFKTTGKLTHELIDAIWTKENNPDCHDNKDLILHLMEKLNIIARPRSFDEAGDEVKENYFLAPCMLDQTTPREVISPKPPEMGSLSPLAMVSSSVLCYVFLGKFLPPAIFHRLLATCVAHWPIAKEMSTNLIFCGCCVFEVDPCHELTLFFKDYVIFVKVKKMSKMNKTPDLKVCIRVREFIDGNLTRIIGYLCQSLKFELYIQCPQSEADSLDSIISISKLQNSEESVCSFHKKKHVVVSQELLKFWFEDEQKMDSFDEIYSGTSNLTTPEECQKSLQKRALPPGKKYHVFFSYSSEDIQWVKKTVERLEQDGFVCCEYDRDNTPGTPLLTFADDSIRDAYKTIVVMTRDDFKSGFVNHEIQMALIQGFDEKRTCVVPVLLKDCKVPVHLRALNYVDARDPSQRDIWWPKLLIELQAQGDLKAPQFFWSNERNQPVSEEASTLLEEGDSKDDSLQQQQ